MLTATRFGVLHGAVCLRLAGHALVADAAAAVAGAAFVGSVRYTEQAFNGDNGETGAERSSWETLDLHI